MPAVISMDFIETKEEEKSLANFSVQMLSLVSLYNE